MLTTQKGEELRDITGAAAYIECSALTQDNLKSVFDAAIEKAITKPKGTLARCGAACVII